MHGYNTDDSDDNVSVAKSRNKTIMDADGSDCESTFLKKSNCPNSNIKKMIKFIPMRLTNQERVLLSVLDNALEVCEYTDIVDVTFSHTHKNKHSRILECLIDVLSISCGLLMSNNLVKGETLIKDRTLNENIPFFRDMFEVGRRFKIMNPHKMRNTYGKLMYIIMDCESHTIKADTGTTFVKDIKTIYNFLVEKEANMSFVEEEALLTASAIVEQNEEIILKYDSITGQCLSNDGGDMDNSINVCDTGAAQKSSRKISDDDEVSGDELDKMYEYNTDECIKKKRVNSNETNKSGKTVGSVVSRIVKRKKSPESIQMQVEAKKKAVDYLVNKYTTETFTQQDIMLVIESISDNNAYYSFNVTPVERMIQLLKDYFNKEKPPAAGGNSSLFSLSLGGGDGRANSSAQDYSLSSLYQGFSMRWGGFGGNRDGAKLSHNHSTQYTYVLQSLSFWLETMKNMPLLWYWADRDMTTESYRLCDTGQGYQRIQQCPNVSNLMHNILSGVQRASDSRWVGLSVIHLGDRDVPNALVFIDKYTQIPRMLSPVAHCIDSLLALNSTVSHGKARSGADMVNEQLLSSYVKAEWGSVDSLTLQILSSFFKNAFDGSGDDGGSCIDGRLTSAWNWCSKIQKKPFYYIFMYTGFQGFDGDWKE